MAYIGAIAAFCINGILLPAENQVTQFVQFGTDGTGFIIGAKRQKASKLVSTHYVASRVAGDALKKAAAALVSTAVSVLRDTGVVTNCFIKSTNPTEDKGVTGVPAGDWKVVIEWELFAPVDW